MKIRNPPDANNLFQSAKSQGDYDLAAALADLIDNSIAADASSVFINFSNFSNLKELTVSILDDGCGMSRNNLKLAMRPASSNPNKKRHENDLGRFGWGLKSASLSQANKLNVTTCNGSDISFASWDLSDCDDFSMEFLSGVDAKKHLINKTAKFKSWTEVSWHECERLTDNYQLSADDLQHYISEAIRELELVFHRFIDENDSNQLKIYINGNKLIANDPFLRNKNTQIEQTQTYFLKDSSGKKQSIYYTPYVLPHFSKISEAELKKLGGADGLIKKQGFYVYRNKRLIIHGTWFGLTEYKSLTQLTRIKLDIPNTLDDLWKITIDKSNLHLPRQLHKHFKEIIKRIKGHSTSKIQRKRHKRVNRIVSKETIWNLTRGNGVIKFSVNIDHPLLNLESYSKDELLLLIKMMETTLPLELIKNEFSVNEDKLCQQPVERSEAYTLLQDIVKMMRKNVPDVTDEEIRVMLNERDFLSENEEILNEILIGTNNE